MKRRLYDFPRRGYIKEWELGNCRDHDRLIDAFGTGDRAAAVNVWRDAHWSFDFQEKYIRRFYFPESIGGRETKEARAAAGNPKQKGNDPAPGKSPSRLARETAANTDRT
jgi:hypothetical protein